jgi:hypothetical protein
MNTRPYLLISGTIFGVVAVFHLLRVLTGWSLDFGSWSVPMWISWLGTVGPAALSVWAFRLARRR